MYLFTLETFSLTASFRIPESHTFQPTLPLPPITSLIGMMGAALGFSFEESMKLAKEIINYQGIGHSAGIYTNSEKEIRLLAANLNVSKIIVNQAHALSNGGGINNSLPFSFTIGCGSWGGNSFSENLNINHFINKTTISKPIIKRKILSEKIFKKLKI